MAPLTQSPANADLIATLQQLLAQLGQPVQVSNPFATAQPPAAYVQIEPFDTDDATSWFERLEAGLTVARVPTSDYILYVQRVLPKEWSCAVRRHLKTLDASADPYQETKTLLTSLTAHGAAHAKRLANLPTLGTKRPSELMRLFLSLLPPGETFSNMHLHHYLLRLPRRLSRPFNNKTMLQIGEPMAFALGLDLEDADHHSYNGTNTTSTPEFGPPLYAKTKEEKQKHGKFRSKQNWTPNPTSSSTSSNPKQYNQAQRQPTSSAPNNFKKTSKPGGGAKKDSKATAANAEDCAYHQKFGSKARHCEGEPCPWASQANEVDIPEDDSDEDVTDDEDAVIEEDEYANQVADAEEDNILARWCAGERRLKMHSCSLASSCNRASSKIINRTVFVCKLTNIPFLIDTGATASFIPKKFCTKLNLSLTKANIPVHMSVANGQTEVLSHQVTVTIDIGFNSMPWTFWVGNIVTPIIGHDLLAYHKLYVCPAGQALLKFNVAKGITSLRSSSRSNSGRVALLNTEERSPVGGQSNNSRPSKDQDAIVPAAANPAAPAGTTVIEAAATCLANEAPANPAIPKAGNAESFKTFSAIDDAVERDNSVPVSVSCKLPKELQPYKNLFFEFNKDSLKTFKAANVKHSIITTGTPCTAKARRLNPKLLAEFDKYLQEMLELGVISPSSSTWSSPLQLVRKKDGTLRPCGDFRRLNLMTVKDEYTLPNVLDLHNNLHSKTVFSRLDLYKGFWQIELDPVDRPKTAIATPRGLFEFNRMPFGLKNAPNTFQRLVDNVFRGVNNVFVYVDDILIASPDRATHLLDLKQVLNRIRENNLIVSFTKSEFFVDKLDFLGFHITTLGSSIPNRRIQAFLDMQVPSTPKAMQRFLGAVNFYRRHLANYARLVAPLYRATTQRPENKPAKWAPDILTAFEQVKNLISRTTLLDHPDTSLPASITTDASTTGIGAVLQQFKQERWVPVAFFSKGLNQAQKKYSPFDLELLSVYEAVKHFRFYLEGLNDFTIFTDHQPLVGALNKKTVAYSPRQQRYLAYIAEFTNDIRHIKGTENTMADMLSRCVMQLTLSSDFDFNALAQDQSQDQPLAVLKAKFPAQYSLQKINNVEMWCHTDPHVRIFVPQKHRLAIFSLIHEQGHPGAKQTRKNLARAYTWPKFYSTVKAMVGACVACNRAKVSRHFHCPLQSFPLPNNRFDHIHVDVIGPLPPCKGGFEYAFTIIDRYSRMPMVLPLKKATALATLNQLISRWIAIFGLPITITSDQGSIFTSEEWANFTKKFNIQHNFSNAYHPQSNGIVERMHRTLKNSLTAANKRDWNSQLPWTMLQLRNARGDDIEYAPTDVTFGGKTRQPLDLACNLPKTPVETFAKAITSWKIPPPCPGRWHAAPTSWVPKNFQSIKHVYIRNPKKKSLRDAYSGPYAVTKWTNKSVTISYYDKPLTLSIDNVKEAKTFKGQFLFFEPALDQQHRFLDDV